MPDTRTAVENSNGVFVEAYRVKHTRLKDNVLFAAMERNYER